MKRTLFFIFVCLTPLVLAMAFVRRVDPGGFFYPASAVRAALSHDPPCDVSLNVVGQEVTPELKFDIVRARKPTIIAIGTSRVLQMRARRGERDFVNLGMPGTGIETLGELFSRLRAERPGRLTIYIAFDTFWLNRTWFPFVSFSHGFDAKFKYLASSEELRQSWTLVRQTPSLLHGWAIDSAGSRCIVDRGGRSASGKVNAWEPDGSIDYTYELVPATRRPPDDDYTRDVATHSGIYYKDWNRLDPARLQLLDAALAQAHSYGWRVAGYFAPYSPRYVHALSTDPQTRQRWRELGRVVPRAFERRGFPFLDLRDVRDVPCPADSFVDDGWHPNEVCNERIRSRLDGALRQVLRRR